MRFVWSLPARVLVAIGPFAQPPLLLELHAQCPRLVVRVWDWPVHVRSNVICGPRSVCAPTCGFGTGLWSRARK